MQECRAIDCAEVEEPQATFIPWTLPIHKYLGSPHRMTVCRGASFSLSLGAH